MKCLASLPHIKWVQAIAGIGDIAIGIVGAFVASWLTPRLGISVGVGMVRAIINATIGAVLCF